MAQHINFEKRYREKYASFGEEYVQQGIPQLQAAVKYRTKRDRKRAELAESQTSDGYWALRRDDFWTEIPAKKVYSKKYRTMMFYALIQEILVSLEPATTFNPYDVWNDLKKKEQEIEDASRAQEANSNNTAPQKKGELIAMRNSQDQLLKQVAVEVTQIRNFKDNLLPLVRQLSTARAREILLVEILKSAMGKNLPEVYDVLWAIEQLDLTKENAPRPLKPTDVQGAKDPSLVYDSYDKVVALLREARQLRDREPDLIRFQLNEMSNRLPPLSPFTGGFRLDPWQKRALSYIDAGKSVIICAPTSSGKTVLSTYVAFIGSKRMSDEEKLLLSKSKKVSAAKATDEQGEAVDVMSDEEAEESDSDEEDDEEERKESAVNRSSVRPVARPHCLPDLERLRLRKNYFDGTQRVLFVVPTEPLVWQVAAFFMKLFRDAGTASTSVAIVTNQLVYHYMRKFGVLPNVVIGTPLALESALTKSRGLVGKEETAHKVTGVILPGGFDHFDWAIYDEVHALDGEEGDALQRIIHAMNCKFLALSATVGNAEELRGWMERAKGDHLMGAEMITALPEEASYFGLKEILPDEAAAQVVVPDQPKRSKGRNASSGVEIHAVRTSDGVKIPVISLTTQSTVGDLKNSIWLALNPSERDPIADVLSLRVDGERLLDNTTSLATFSRKLLNVEIETCTIRFIRTLDSEMITIAHVSPTSRLIHLKSRISQRWPLFAANAWQLHHITTPSNAVVGLAAEPIVKYGTSVVATLPSDVVISAEMKLLIRSEGGNDEIVVVSSRSIEYGESSVEGLRRVEIRTSQFAKNHPVRSEVVLVHVTELLDNSKTLEELGLYDRINPSIVPLIQTMTLVNMLSHQVRFINLQRFEWRGDKLEPISPLAAVKSVESLQQGILNHSNLSFTSRDCHRVWVELEKFFPREDIAKFDPHIFFDIKRRITLQDSKDYEDFLKHGLQELAIKCPIETKELLYKFRLEEPDKRVDMCTLALKLKAEEKLPGLAFHRNPFEAIRIFQQLLAGLEYRQKCQHPLYFTNQKAEKADKKKDWEKQIKDTGRNEKQLEEAQKSGAISTSINVTVNEHEPHPDYRFCVANVMNEDEYANLSADMERYDGFTKRDAAAMTAQFGMNDAVNSHALMRGLRRGIGLYINEVSCPSYRRAVQRLASQGKLAIVVSDDSLAFGVNMPFRTCIFCGEMDGALTPLMAQQMSGRAGRRGLDTEGNLVYVGCRPSFVQSIMIGEVANITGSLYRPRYETCFLQHALSPRHVGFSRMESIVGRTLEDYVNGKTTLPDSNLAASKKALIDLGLIQEDALGNWIPSTQREILSMVWELRGNVGESICIGQLLPDLFQEIESKIREIKTNRSGDPQQGRKDKDLHARLLPVVFSILLQIIDRYPYDPSHNLPPLHEHHHFSADRPLDRDVFFRWREKIRRNQENLPPNLQHLRLPLFSEAALDSTFFQCVLDQHYIHSLNDHQKQQMKARMWHIGTTLRLMWNNLWPCNEFYEVFGVLHTCFRRIWYLNTELVRSQIHFDDVSAADQESKADVGRETRLLPQAAPWSDNNLSDTTYSTPVPFALAAERCITRMKDWLAQNANAPTQRVNEELMRLCSGFTCFRSVNEDDLSLLRQGFKCQKELLPVAVAKFSSSLESPRHLIGTLLWFCTSVAPSLSTQFPILLRQILEHPDGDFIATADILRWVEASIEDNLSTIPEGASISVEAVEKIKTSAAMRAFVNYLNLPEEEEEEDDDEEEES